MLQRKITVYICNSNCKLFILPYIDINECASNPCLNGGTCIDSQASYNCDCIQGLTGNNCQIGSQ